MHLKWKLYTSNLLAVPLASCNVLLCLIFCAARPVEQLDASAIRAYTN